MVDLTVVIITKDEEKNIEKCISSVKNVAKRVVVVDSSSSDKTVEIATSLGADCYQHEFISHAEKFNWALDNTEISTSWVMKLDADEELTEELQEEINTKLDNLPCDVAGIILRRRVYFMGRWLKHGGKYPELLVRIFRKGKGRAEDRKMDEHMIVDGSTVSFKYDFSDNNTKDLTWWIGKHNWFASNEVESYLNMASEEKERLKTQSIQVKIKRFIKNHGYYNLPMFFRAHLFFIYRYYFRLGFLDGKEGKIYTFLQAYWYRFLVDAKLYEMEIKMGKELNSDTMRGG